MKRGDGELNIMMPGRCILGIFAYVGINRLASLADSYGQDVTVLVNKVAKIIHGCAKHWGGVANQNIDNGFFLVWKLDNQYDPQSSKVDLKNEVLLKRSKMADKAFFCGLKMLSQLERFSSRRSGATEVRVA
ncbi:hypothetical protein Pmar_PMAR001583 [Perkinsus marinus ATCC 50983]|uniref:Guanylate cyclase domain-containing protein n=1 Tax=Perkinsus marinus (strain ATCC 50983 / TXsc) TaxID=423536 RepID=C5KLE3_PERM5|nr:hypothetical protein Pmar_PMAR001583 [Perkinsus marinus ATCC 50983]EER14700.1 hypothetical protein Pmar_PMAR001583 [Perkinsus marinus ATCC 50983]|eukprot:XP_002782904.1 hypothetical protein Pmar_PMAR001583 [Perkinsus marinus ATCC 50983]